MSEPEVISAEVEAFRRRHLIGSRVRGTVTKVMPFGAFVDLGIPVTALLLVVGMANPDDRQLEFPAGFPQVGQTIETLIARYGDARHVTLTELSSDLPSLRPHQPPPGQTVVLVRVRGPELSYARFRRHADGSAGSLTAKPEGPGYVLTRSIAEGTQSAWKSLWKDLMDEGYIDFERARALGTIPPDVGLPIPLHDDT